MAAPKDDGQMPPEGVPPGGGRRAVIWRLPATRDADDSAGAEAEAEAAAEAPRSARASRGRRPPWPVVWGLAAALVAMGLYAAWSAVGRDIWSTRPSPDGTSAPASASASAPASTAPPLAAEGAGDAPPGGGDATAPPPRAADGARLADAEEGTEADSGAGAEAGSSGGDAPPGGGDATAAPPRAADGARFADAEEGTEADSGAGAEAGSSGGAAPVVGEGAEEGAETAPAGAAESMPAQAPADSPSPSPSATAAGDGTQATAPAPAANGDDAVSAAPAQARNTASADSGTGPGGLDALAARLAALEARAGAGAGVPADAVAALERRVRSLEDDPTRDALAGALGEWAEQRAVLEAELATLGTRLAQFEAESARQAAADGQLVALVLATGGLTAALGSSRPFTPALDTLRGVAGGDPEIDDALARLAPLAATGAATLDGLRARYPEAANAVVRAAPAGDDADWIDETVTRLSQLVTIRRTGGAMDPASLDGRLVAVEAALAAGDLAQAIAVFETLMPGSAEDARAGDARAGDGRAAEWLRDARARHAADAALAGLVDTLRARVGARWASGAAPP